MVSAALEYGGGMVDALRRDNEAAETEGGKVRHGKVRVLLGPTLKMGTGSNVQDKLIAIHDADCPWRSADLAQRAGRIASGKEQRETV